MLGVAPRLLNDAVTNYRVQRTVQLCGQQLASGFPAKALDRQMSAVRNAGLSFQVQPEPVTRHFLGQDRHELRLQVTGEHPVTATNGCGWSDDDYEHWLSDILRRQLLN